MDDVLLIPHKLGVVYTLKISEQHCTLQARGYNENDSYKGLRVFERYICFLLLLSDKMPSVRAKQSFLNSCLMHVLTLVMQACSACPKHRSAAFPKVALHNMFLRCSRQRPGHHKRLMPTKCDRGEQLNSVFGFSVFVHGLLDFLVSAR